jgi:hypothetical protein
MTLLHRRAGGTGETTRTDAAVAGAAYHAWGWPVMQRGDLIQLSLDGDAGAVAIPIPLSAAVTQLLTTRRCNPAVLAHPYAPEHHIVLTGEGFGAPLPWPSGAYQVAGPLMLPPTMTIDGPVIWERPPDRDSLQSCREIDVFGALRSTLRD